jgi:DNA-binding MarR family transcriptional regulator
MQALRMQEFGRLRFRVWHDHCATVALETVARRENQRAKAMEYQVTDSVPYLLNRVGVELGERFSLRLRDVDVTLPMYRALAVLRQTGTLTLGALSALVSVELSTLSRLVSSMVKRGLVSRVRPEDNARIVRIDLTDAGRDLVDQLIPVALHFEETAVAGLSPAQIQDLKSLLRQIHSHVTSL